MTAEVLDSSDVKTALLEQIQDKRDAVQKQKTNEVHVRQDAGDGEQVGEGGEEFESSHDNEPEEERASFKFVLGDEVFEVAEDAEFELKADGKPIKMTLKEMRDAAAGGVAVRNRMRQLAEEKKRLHDPYKNFIKFAEDDPFLALKKIFSVIKQVEPKADMNKFLVGLGKQAQNMAKLSPSERKAYELERELEETRDNLTESERIAKIQRRQQEIIEEYGFPEEKILQFGKQILDDPVISKSVQNEDELFDRIEELADEVQRQQAVVAALHKYDPKIKHNDPLVFELSALLEKNPDFHEGDLDDIAERLLKEVKKTKVSSVLSKRQRSSVVKGYKPAPDYSRLAPKDALKAQLLEKRKQLKK